jgi:hypothetical protein
MHMNTYEICEVLPCPMKAYMGCGGVAPLILTLTLARSEQLYMLVILPW